MLNKWLLIALICTKRVLNLQTSDVQFVNRGALTPSILNSTVTIEFRLPVIDGQVSEHVKVNFRLFSSSLLLPVEAPSCRVTSSLHYSICLLVTDLSLLQEGERIVVYDKV